MHHWRSSPNRTWPERKWQRFVHNQNIHPLEHTHTHSNVGYCGLHQKFILHLHFNSGSRSSLTISQTQYSSTSSSSFSLLRTARARTSSALVGSVCSRWDSLRFVRWCRSCLKLTSKKKINLLSSPALPGIVPQFQRCLSSSAAATHGAPGGRLAREQAALCCRDHLWTDQRLQALELLEGTQNTPNNLVMSWLLKVLCRPFNANKPVLTLVLVF